MWYLRDKMSVKQPAPTTRRLSARTLVEESSANTSSSSSSSHIFMSPERQDWAYYHSTPSSRISSPVSSRRGSLIQPQHSVWKSLQKVSFHKAGQKVLPDDAWEIGQKKPILKMRLTRQFSNTVQKCNDLSHRRTSLTHAAAKFESPPLILKHRRSSATSLLDLSTNFFKSAKVMQNPIQPLDVNVIAKVSVVLKLIKNFGFSFPDDDLTLSSELQCSKLLHFLFCLGVWPWWDDCGRKVCPICQPLWRQTIQGTTTTELPFPLKSNY